MTPSQKELDNLKCEVMILRQQHDELGVARSSEAGHPVGARVVESPPFKKLKYAQVGTKQLHGLEDYNMAKRIAMTFTPENKQLREWMRKLTTTPIYPYRPEESQEFHQVPARLEIIPTDEEGVEQLNGGFPDPYNNFVVRDVASPHPDFQCMQ